MIGAGTSIYTDFDEYRSVCLDAQIDTLHESVRNFRARLTWVELDRIKLLRVHEHLPHVAIIALPPNSVVVVYPIASATMPTWCGVPLRRSDIVVHAVGQRVYEFTRGPATWASISIPAGRLAAYGRIWADLELCPPETGQVYDLSTSSIAYLRRLHAKVCRLVITRPEIITNREVVRSLEEELIQALIGCLADGTPRAELFQSDLMRRVDEALAGQLQVDSSVAELCAAARVPEASLREHCRRLTGMSPELYIRIRKMNVVRTALRESKSDALDLASAASRYGVRDVERFIREYKGMFGEDTVRG